MPLTPCCQIRNVYETVHPIGKHLICILAKKLCILEMFMKLYASNQQAPNLHFG
jgi:hypothetical protein